MSPKMKVSAPDVTRADQVAFAKVEKLRKRDPEDIRHALILACGKEALDIKTISDISASALDVASDDQISYVKVETKRDIDPIMDVYRAARSALGPRTFSSSTYSRWSRTFKQGKSVKLGYQKVPPSSREASELVKQLFNPGESSGNLDKGDDGDSSKISDDSDTD